MNESNFIDTCDTLALCHRAFKKAAREQDADLEARATSVLSYLMYVIKHPKPLVPDEVLASITALKERL